MAVEDTVAHHLLSDEPLTWLPSRKPPSQPMLLLNWLQLQEARELRISSILCPWCQGQLKALLLLLTLKRIAIYPGPEPLFWTKMLCSTPLYLGVLCIYPMLLIALMPLRVCVEVCPDKGSWPSPFVAVSILLYALLTWRWGFQMFSSCQWYFNLQRTILPLIVSKLVKKKKEREVLGFAPGSARSANVDSSFVTRNTITVAN